MIDKKRVKLKGIKHTPKRLESDILEKSKNLWENPSLIRPKCAGKCFLCPFDKTFSSINKIGSLKENSDALIKLSSKGKDDIFKAYCATISLYAAGSVPYLATTKLAGEEISFAQRGSVGKDKLIGALYYDDPRIRLLLFNTIAKKKNLHIYSFGENIVCSKRPNMPVDYIHDTFLDTPYEFPNNSLQCDHESDGALIIKILSAEKKIRVCNDCVKDVSTLQHIIARMIAVDVLDDFEVYVEHIYHSENEDGIVKIDEKTLRDYSLGIINDASLLNSIIKDRIKTLKSRDTVTYIIGSKNYGSETENFLNNLKGSEIDIKAISEYLKKNPRSIIIRDEKATEVLKEIWSDYRGVIAALSSDEIANSFVDVSKLNPSQVLKNAYNKHISFDVVSCLPVFKQPGVITKYADNYTKAAKVGGPDMLRQSILEIAPKDSKTRSLSVAFTTAMGIEPIVKCTDKEMSFATYLLPFVKQLIESDGEKYRENMNVLLTATGSGESV